MKSKEELKKSFENGDKPTQEEFWEWQDSYWHKDEKLPTEAAGIYKIKGSVTNLAALNALTGMEEGDVYNLLDTGDNYVYVLDLNNTGVAGWDKLSGIVNLSGINLQTVLENGGYASNGNSIANFDLENGIFQMSISSGTGYENTQILQSSDNIYITKTTMSGVSTPIEINQGGFLNGADFSQRPEFGDRNLVDKGYVDNKPSNATLQSVLDNGSAASSPNGSYIQLTPGEQFGTSIYYDLTGEGTSISNNATTIYFNRVFDILGTSTAISVQKGGLKYDEDYSQRPEFGDRNLVDKGYVNSAISDVIRNLGSINLVNTSTIYSSSSDLNNDYPDVRLGFEVYSTSSGHIHKKITDTSWSISEVNLLP